MRFTATLDPHRGAFRLDAEHALHYPADHVARLVAAAAEQAVVDRG